ncbi:MAG: family 20 glycosylhydrolase [Myxococcota bacterium]
MSLFPAPRELALGGEGAALDAPVTPVHDASLPDEGFALTIDPGGVRIEHADANGLRYAQAALAQVRAQSEDRLPGLRLRDAPDFPVRGVMLDVSRDRVPTRATLLRWLDLLALCRLNQLQLYTEHTFAYRDHETVWRDASPITPDDVRWLDAECAARGVELVANQNAFGHMGRWLAHERYRDRAEAPDGWEAPGLGRRAPAVLEPTEDNARFAVDLVRELMECFTSRRVNIGCDETFELGLGRSRARVDAQGRGRVYLEHLKRLLSALHGDGLEVLFWGDILRSHPDLVGELPRERSVALAWHYEAPLAIETIPDSLRSVLEPFGVTAESLRGFAGQVPAFVDNRFPHWVCPGTSSWNSFLGRWSNARANLLDAADVGRRSRSGGYLLTDWGDNGHLQPPVVSFAPLVLAGALAWGADANRQVDVAAVLDRHVLEDRTQVLGSLLLEVGDAFRSTGRRAFNASPLFAAVVPGALSFGEADAKALRALADGLSEAWVRAGQADPQAEDGSTCVRELRQAIRLARHGAWRMLGVDGARLRADLEECIEEQRACWRLRSREGGFADSVARLERALAPRD